LERGSGEKEREKERGGGVEENWRVGWRQREVVSEICRERWREGGARERKTGRLERKGQIRNTDR
jgi:hypothetical protein